MSRFDIPIEAGEFYEDPHIGFFYYCRAIVDELAHLILVESFQHGRLIQSEFTQKPEYTNLYIEVTDPAILARLQQRFSRLPAQSASKQMG
jgi:hypothetical protein